MFIIYYIVDYNTLHITVTGPTTGKVELDEDNIEIEDPLLVTIQPGNIEIEDPLLVTIQPGNIGCYARKI